LLAIAELEREEGSERTAKSLVELASGTKGDVVAVALHALGKMGGAAKAVLPELAEALVGGDFPTQLLNELGVGDIPLWLAEALVGAEYPVADNAAFALATRFDLNAEKRLLPMLVEAASRSDPDEENWQQYWAIHALAKMRGTAAPAQAMLLEVLRKEPASDAQQRHGGKANIVRGVAAYALGQIGCQPDNAVPVLVQLLEHPDQTIRDWCALGLALFEKQKNPKRAARMLVALRARCVPEVAAAAADALGRMGETGKAVLPKLARSFRGRGFPPEFLHQYDHGDIPLWLAEALLQPHASAVEHLGPALAWSFDLSGETRLIPLLAQGARHKNPEVQCWAIDTLAGMGQTAASARPLLVEILKEEPSTQQTRSERMKRNKVRASAAFALASIARDAESTAPLLAEMLEHPDPVVWEGAALALGRMEERATPALSALMGALTKEPAPNPWTKIHPAVHALSRIGRPAIPTLVEALQSMQPVVRQRAAAALGGMLDKELTQGALIKAATEDEDQEVRRSATLALGFPYGSDRNDAVVVPALVRIVKDRTPEVRAAGVRVLAALRPDEYPSAPFVALLRDPAANVRLDAVRAFTDLRPRREITFPLESLLNDPDDDVRVAAERLRDHLRGGAP
jgi:HEAT repeat protein